MYVYMKYPPIHSRSGAVGQLQPHSYYFLATHPLVSQWTVSQSKACWLPGLLMTYLRLANSLIISYIVLIIIFWNSRSLISMYYTLSTLSSYLRLFINFTAVTGVRIESSRVEESRRSLPVLPAQLHCIALLDFVSLHSERSNRRMHVHGNGR